MIRRDQGRRLGWLVLAQVALLGLVASPVRAEVSEPFTTVLSTTVRGDIVMAANSLMTCSGEGCDEARYATTSGPTSSGANNNAYPSQYIDVDADPATLNSSQATLSVPSGGTVLHALLVWGATTTPTHVTNGSVGSATLTVPGGQTYPVAATRVDHMGTSPVYYQSSLDVTDIVAQAGSGSYTMAGVTASVGQTNQFAGWALVVAVSDPSAPLRHLTVLSGFASVYQSDVLTTTIDDLAAPVTGPVRTTVGLVAYEGDADGGGDAVTFDGTALSDSLNSATNMFNSTISDRGAQVLSRTPAYTNQLGFDADLINGDGALTHGATSAELTLSGPTDKTFLGVLTVATELYEPDLVAQVDATDVDGGAVLPGDTVRYRIQVDNVGLDTAVGCLLTDAIPAGAHLVPGSISVDGVPVTDAVDDDVGQVSPSGTVSVRVGGGSMAPGATHVVVVSVVVDGTVSAVVSSVVLGYSGATTGTVWTGSSAPSTVTVLSPPTATADAAATATDAPVLVDVLANDTDPNPSDVLTVASVTAPVDADGTVRGTTTVEDGGVRYSPATGFAGAVTFGYTVSDGTSLATATVEVSVTDAAPVAVDDQVVLHRGEPVTVDVLANDTDANIPGTSQRLSVAWVDAGPQVDVQVVDDRLVVLVPAGSSGPYPITYGVSDGAGGTSEATVRVVVENSPPVAVDDTASTLYGQTVSVQVLANDVDVDADGLVVVEITSPVDQAGRVRGAARVVAGVVTVEPAAGFCGTVSVTYTVVDPSGGRSTADLTVEVGAPAVGQARAVSGRSVVVPVVDPASGLTLVGVTQPAAGGSARISGGSVVITTDADFVGAMLVGYEVRDPSGEVTQATFVVQVLAAQLASTGASVGATAGWSALLLLLGAAIRRLGRRSRSDRGR